MVLDRIVTQLVSGELRGASVEEVVRTVGDLRGFWGCADVPAEIQDRPLYRTQTWFPHPDGTVGAVLWGNTTLYAGDVAGEFFMTRGHWHLKRTHGELVVTVSGSGLLVLMDEDRNQIEQEMQPGSTHHIDGCFAHRTVNTGTEPLVFLCAWPADCGHDYTAIRDEGFARRYYRPGV